MIKALADPYDIFARNGRPDGAQHDATEVVNIVFSKTGIEWRSRGNRDMLAHATSGTMRTEVECGVCKGKRPATFGPLGIITIDTPKKETERHRDLEDVINNLVSFYHVEPSFFHL